MKLSRILLVAGLCVAGVAALLSPLLIRAFLFQPCTIPSAAMEPTLHEGDYIVVSKGAYGYSRHSILGSPPLFRGRIGFQVPARGDIIRSEPSSIARQQKGRPIWPPFFSTEKR